MEVVQHRGAIDAQGDGSNAKDDTLIPGEEPAGHWPPSRRICPTRV